ncbi:small-subunit processome [Meredithblackwellia eburnea MCA 4105]
MGSAPRRGRQPANPTQKPQKGSKPAGPGKSKGKSKASASSSAPLDVYSFSSSQKRARGDVDPAARARSNSGDKKGKFNAKSKGKGKEREVGGDSEEDEEDEGSVDGQDFLGGIDPSKIYIQGASDDDGQGINSEDDEDIDSDEAFEDEEDLPAKPKKGKNNKIPASHRPQIDLDEEELDLDDEDGAGFMDISELLDNGEYASEDDEDDSDEGDSEEEDEEDESMDSGEESDGDGGAAALSKLNSFVDGLEGKKRKIETPGDDGAKKKRVVLKERTEAYPEGEFVAVTSGDARDKVNLDDLLSSFTDSKNPRLAALRKTLKPLATPSPTTSPVSTSSKSHLKTSGPIAAPLPSRLQDKIEREAAYEKTKEETDKWNETVRRMKGESGIGAEGARHERLTLPLMGGGGDVARDPNANEWSAKFQPMNDLEASVQSLLDTNQMSARDIEKAEKAALATLDPEELAKRQADLRQQRDLMFRAERKARRVSKIKSKAFRRIHRRAKGKDGEPNLTLEDMAELDRIDGGDRVTEEKARLEIARAKERASLKHSSKSGKWAKGIGEISGLGEERNTAIREMVARKEQLRKRIAGIDSDDEMDEFEPSGSEEDDEDADFDTIKGTAFDELASLEAKEAAAAGAGPKLKGVLNMKFMKDAMARDARKAQGEVDEFRQQLAEMEEDSGQGADSGEDDEEDDVGPVGLSAQVQGNLGRMVFGPSATSAPASATSSLSIPAASKSHSAKLSGPLAVAAPRPSPLAVAGEANPWLETGDADISVNKVSRKMNKAASGKSSRDSERLAIKVDRHKAKQADARTAADDDAQVEIDPTVVLAVTKAPAAPQLSRKSLEAKAESSKSSVAAPTEGDEASSDEDEDFEGRGPTAFKQRDLVAKAFAGDDVVAEFEAEKRREIERDAPREEDNTLPGWGAWSGKGVKKQKNAKKFITKIAGIDPSQRQDAKLAHVIISERKDKKAGKYMLKDLPFPYTSAAQHEQKLRTPLGPEWSTSTVVRDQTLPKVLVKPGVTIRPVDRKV